MEFIDQINRVVYLPKTPLRIISLVPSQTELLVDLGLRENIVGVTKFCVHPVDLRTKKNIVGGTKSVNLDKIESLKPDIIICNKEENTEDMVLQLESIAPVWVSDISNISECLEMIDKLGEILEVSEIATRINSEIYSEWHDFKMYSKKLPSVKAIYLIWKKPFMAAGRATFINELLKLNNFENIIEMESSRYPEVAKDLITKAEVVLLSTEPYPFNEKHVSDLREMFDVEVKLVDGEYFSWYGSRLIKAFEYFKTLH